MKRYLATLVTLVFACPLARAAELDFSQASDCSGYLDESMVARVSDARYEEATISEAVLYLLNFDADARRAVLDQELMKFELPPDFDGEEGIVKLQKYRAIGFSDQAQCLRDVYRDGVKVERISGPALHGFVVSLEGQALAVALTHVSVN